MRILVVDDNKDAAESTALLLVLHGHDTRVAFDGPAALRVAREYRPDIAIIDIGLPVLNGFDVARQLRQLPGLERVGLIAVTGFTQEDIRRRCEEAGFEHHFLKPVDPELVVQVLNSVEVGGCPGCRPLEGAAIARSALP